VPHPPPGSSYQDYRKATTARTSWGSARLLITVLLLCVSAALAHHPALSLAELTPGDVFPDVTAEQLSQIGYSKKARHVSFRLRQQVFAEYRIPFAARNDYEVDHLVSLAIGGSNSIRNLWLEPLRLSENGYDLGAVTKDRLEDKLHWLVVSGQLEVKEAQKAIAENWVDAYRKYVGKLPLYTYELRAR
jgi:hypothetical protein